MSDWYGEYTFVWWGDGYFVFQNGEYIGKDDQVDILQMLLDTENAERFDMPPEWEDEEWGASAPDDIHGVKLPPYTGGDIG